ESRAAASSWLGRSRQRLRSIRRTARYREPWRNSLRCRARQDAEDGFGVHPNRVVRAPIGGERRHLEGRRPKIPTAAPPYGPTDRIGRLRYFAPPRIQATGRLDNRLVLARHPDALNPLLTLSR